MMVGLTEPIQYCSHQKVDGITQHPECIMAIHLCIVKIYVEECLVHGDRRNNRPPRALVSTMHYRVLNPNQYRSGSAGVNLQGHRFRNNLAKEVRWFSESVSFDPLISCSVRRREICSDSSGGPVERSLY